MDWEYEDTYDSHAMLTVRKISGGSDLEKLVMTRLIFQSKELMNATTLSEEDRDRVLTQCLNSIAPKLIHCGQEAESIERDAQHQSKKFYIDDFGNAQNFPHIIGLEQKSSDFLYTIRNFIRDVGSVFEVFFGIKFTKSSDFFDAAGKRDGRVVRWACQKFGEDDPLVSVVSAHQAWIGEVCKKRNAVEHPDEYSGKLVVENFGITKDGLLIVPRWRRDPGGEDVDMIEDMQDYFKAGLFFAEEVIARCIEKHLMGPLQIVAVPFEEQDPALPVRLRFAIPEKLLREP